MKNNNYSSSATASRRRLIRILAFVGSTEIGYLSLPRTWTKPIVDLVLIPAHGQTSIAPSPPPPPTAPPPPTPM